MIENFDLTTLDGHKLSELYSLCDKAEKKQIMDYVKHNYNTLNESSNKADIFLMDIYRNCGLKVHEEIAEFYILHHGRLITAYIRKYFSSYSECYFREFFEAGRIGIFQALTKFDPEKSRPSTFFTEYVRGEISDYISKEFKKTTKHYANVISKIEKAKIRLINKGIAEPSVRDIANETGINSVTIYNAMSCKNISSSASFEGLYENLDQSDNASEAIIEDSIEHIVEKESERNTIMKTISMLPDEEAFIIRKYFGFDGKRMSDIEISKCLNTTPFIVKKSRNKAISSLRNSKLLQQEFNRTVMKNEILDDVIINCISKEAVFDEIDCIELANLDDINFDIDSDEFKNMAI